MFNPYNIYFLAEEIEDEINDNEIDEKIKEILIKKINFYKKEFIEINLIKKYLEGDISLEEYFNKASLNDIEKYKKDR